MTLKNNRAPFCILSLNFVPHSIATCEFKLDLLSGNAQIGAKFVLSYVTLISVP